MISTKRICPAAFMAASVLLAGCDGARSDEPFTRETGPDAFATAVNASRSGDLWSGTEELRLGGSDEGPELFGRIGGLEVDAAGRIYIVDPQAAELRAFGPDGRHLWTAGRDGAGPGELRAPTGVVLAPDGLLWVPELGNQRYSRFETSGAFVDVLERRVIGRLTPWQATFDPEGRLVEGGVGIGADRVTYQAVFRRGDGGELVDTLRLPVPERQFFDLPTTQFIFAIPYTANLAWTPARDGTLWTANTVEYRVVRRTLRGDSVEQVTMAVEPERPSAAEREGLEARVLEVGGDHVRPQLGRIPDRKHYLEAIRQGDDGSLWVRLPVPRGADSTAFDVFNSDGRHTASVGLPVRLGDHVVVRRDVIVGTAETALGEPVVVRWRVGPSAGPR